MPWVMIMACSFFSSSSSICPSLILSSVFIMTVVVPLSAFLTLILVFCLSSLIACRSLKGRLFLGVIILTSASCVLTLLKMFLTQPMVGLVVSTLI